MHIEDVCPPYARRPHRQWKAVSVRPEAWATKDQPEADPRRWIAAPRTKMRTAPERAETLQTVFRDLANHWKRDTVNLSDVGQIILNDSYQRIIGLGPNILPHIFRALQQELDWWFPALRAIAGVDPIADGERGDLEAMRRSWLRWAERNGYL